MIVSINQPAYLPWLGYFDRIACSDVHVVLDNVQFEKNSFTNRNRVRTAQGSAWLTVPVQTSGRFGSLDIATLKIADDPRWAAKHWQTISQAYARAPFFAAHRDFFAGQYARHWDYLAALVAPTTDYLLDAFGIRTPLHRASALRATGKKDDLVLAICRELGATVYLSGPLGRDYLDEAKFAAAGIAVRYADYAHPTYPQAHPGFVPFMAAIDLLFMAGPEAGAILRTSTRAEIAAEERVA